MQNNEQNKTVLVQEGWPRHAAEAVEDFFSKFLSIQWHLWENSALHGSHDGSKAISVPEKLNNVVLGPASRG